MVLEVALQAVLSASFGHGPPITPQTAFLTPKHQLQSLDPTPLFANSRASPGYKDQRRWRG